MGWWIQWRSETCSLTQIVSAIYTDDSDTVKCAMDKLIMESGGMVLRTFWTKVDKGNLELNCPDDMR